MSRRNETRIEARRIVAAAEARLKKHGPRPCSTKVAPGTTYTYTPGSMYVYTSGSTGLTYPPLTTSSRSPSEPALPGTTGFEASPGWVVRETGTQPEPSQSPRKPVGMLNNPWELARILMQHEAEFLMDIFYNPIDPDKKGLLLSVMTIRTGSTEFMQRTGLFRMANLNGTPSRVWIAGLSSQGFRVVAELLRLGKPVKAANTEELIQGAETMASATRIAYESHFPDA